MRLTHFASRKLAPPPALVAARQLARVVIGASLSAPHRRVCCGISLYILYIYLVRCAVSHFRLLFCAFLHLSLFQKLFTNYSYSARRHQPSISLIATARTETTGGPTYSMVRTIGATAWQKGFICRCHYLCCHSVEVTRYIDRPLQ